jgi:hypothetical protein
MIKMNFNNQLKDEDKQLIKLLKDQMLEPTPDEFVENTMVRLEALQGKTTVLHKPLKTPLYFMVAIVVLLFLPYVIPMISMGSFHLELSEFLVYPISSILNYAILCWLSLVALWISTLLFPISLKIDFNPFRN